MTNYYDGIKIFMNEHVWPKVWVATGQKNDFDIKFTVCLFTC